MWAAIVNFQFLQILWLTNITKSSSSIAYLRIATPALPKYSNDVAVLAANFLVTLTPISIARALVA